MSCLRVVDLFRFGLVVSSVMARKGPAVPAVAGDLCMHSAGTRGASCEVLSMNEEDGSQSLSIALSGTSHAQYSFEKKLLRPTFIA